MDNMDNYVDIYTTALITSIQQLNPSFDISYQEEEIRTETTNMFFGLSRVGDIQALGDIKALGDIQALGDITPSQSTTYGLLRMITPVKFGIPIVTY